MNAKDLYELVRDVCDDQRVGWPKWLKPRVYIGMDTKYFTGFTVYDRVIGFDQDSLYLSSILFDHLWDWLAATKEALKGLHLDYIGPKDGYVVLLDDDTLPLVMIALEGKTKLHAVVEACKRLLKNKGEKNGK